MDKQRLWRALLKTALRPLVRWEPLAAPVDGWSIVLGTPWDLRQLLEVNLLFVSKTDRTGLDRVIVVFDRVEQPGGREFVDATRARFPDLPLEFHFHPPGAGRLVRRIDQSKFYASLNWVTGLAHCRTRHAVLHDFDLYPLDPAYFRRIVAAMAERRWRFSGAEWASFDGLTPGDRLIGTWSLGVDVEWLRSTHVPTDCFHAVAQVNGRRVDLDAFNLVQSGTPERGLAPGVGPESFAHVTNLCSTYLRFRKGEAPKVVWRLHFLWYLESLAGRGEHFRDALAAMRSATSPVLLVGDYRSDFSGEHETSANVLRDGLRRLETALHGEMRPHVAEYCEAFAAFLGRFGDTRPVEELVAGRGA